MWTVCGISVVLLIKLCSLLSCGKTLCGGHDSELDPPLCPGLGQKGEGKKKVSERKKRSEGQEGRGVIDKRNEGKHDREVERQGGKEKGRQGRREEEGQGRKEKGV
jgi:hypothetical protein